MSRASCKGVLGNGLYGRYEGKLKAKEKLSALFLPAGVAATGQPDRCVYVADSANHRICLINISSGIVATIGGDVDGKKLGLAGFRDTSSKQIKSQFNEPKGVAVMKDHIAVCDTHNNRVRLISRIDGENMKLLDLLRDPCCS